MEPTWGFDGCWKPRLSVQTIVTSLFQKQRPEIIFFCSFLKLEFLSGFLSQGFCSFTGQEARKKVSGNMFWQKGHVLHWWEGQTEWMVQATSVWRQRDGWRESKGLPPCSWSEGQSRGGGKDQQAVRQRHRLAWDAICTKASSCLLHALQTCPEEQTLSSHKLLQSHLSKHCHPP